MRKIVVFCSILLIGSVLCFANERPGMCADSLGLSVEKDRNPRDTRRPREPRRPRNEHRHHQHESSFGKRITLGLAFGIGPDWLNPKSDSLERGGTTTMMRFGIPLDINFTQNENYYFATGVFFSHLGGQLRMNAVPHGDSLVLPIERRYTSLNISIPTGIKLKTPSMKNFVIVGNFGLLHTFRLSAKASDRLQSDESKLKPNKYMYQDNVALFKESGYIGLGFEYIVSDNFRVYFNTTYSHGFTNFFKAKKLPDNANNATHSGVEFQVGLSF